MMTEMNLNVSKYPNCTKGMVYPFGAFKTCAPIHFPCQECIHDTLSFKKIYTLQGLSLTFTT